jgi:hypothetical protein
MPMAKAKKEWEKIEEENLIYVAYTRAKHLLGLISEKEIVPSGRINTNDSVTSDITLIETKLSILLGRELSVNINHDELAKFRVKCATKIDDLHKNDNKIVISKIDDSSDCDLLEELEKLL